MNLCDFATVCDFAKSHGVATRMALWQGAPVKLGVTMLDLYSKIVLSVIAASLATIAWQGYVSPATAQMGSGCGDSTTNPCWIDTISPLEVYVR